VNIATPHGFGDRGDRLLRAIGLDTKNCRKATITIEVDSAIIIEAEFFAEEPADDGELEVLTRYYRLFEFDSEPEELLK